MSSAPPLRLLPFLIKNGETYPDIHKPHPILQSLVRSSAPSTRPTQISTTEMIVSREMSGGRAVDAGGVDVVCTDDERGGRLVLGMAERMDACS
ncbi:MAG: hypothetical protein L6R40_002471 [Gallowayella cf. fulva]|nr:MAG: hypothetical protein L6R40_002471 [Xanthomendoza cf. fulva]